MALLKKYWPEIVLIVTGIWSTTGPQIQAFVTAHPQVSTVIGVIVAIGTHLLPSPVASKTV